jgi:hypothetical protein
MPKAKPGCPTCGHDGFFRDPDGNYVGMGNDEDDEEDPVVCQHSVAGNIAEIRRIHEVSEGYWHLAKTGWREIDAAFGMADNDDISLQSQYAVQ